MEEYNNTPVYCRSHHGVLREASKTTKLYVVFNGSSPSDSGVSLNDLQMVGPTIQSDLMSILLRFRCHNYVVCSDTAKMYWQILLNSTNSCESFSTYCLNTVTYGTAYVSFLAVIAICDQVTNILHSAKILKGFLNRDKESDVSSEEKPKTLGLLYSCDSDKLKFSHRGSAPKSKNITKRILFEAFDPLGLVSPPSQSIISWWLQFHDELSSLNFLEIQRQAVFKHGHNLEIHGFSGASQKAYGGCINVKSIDKDGRLHCHLLCAKGKWRR